jgi:hypothetical protein
MKPTRDICITCGLLILICSVLAITALIALVRT